MKLLTEGEVAQLCGITKPCLRRWRYEARELPFVRVGRLVRYRTEDVERYISSNLQPVGQSQAEQPADGRVTA